MCEALDGMPLLGFFDDNWVLVADTLTSTPGLFPRVMPSTCDIWTL